MTGAILTLGLGTFGSVNLLPTLGYLSREPVPPPALQGGHFGYDEKRNKKELEDIQQRRKALQQAFYGLPEEEKQEVAAELTGEPTKTVDWQPFVVDYQKYLVALEKIESAIREKEEESELNELIALGVI